MTPRINFVVNRFFFAVVFLLLVCSASEAQTKQTIVRPMVLKIAEKLQKDNQVHFGYPVAFAGKLEIGNKYYKLYKKLDAKATNAELVELTKCKSVLVVVYTFDILQSRNYEGLKAIFFEHLNDTTWFWTAGGCTGLLDRVNWFMFRRLTQSIGNMCKTYLSKNEIELYCSRFKREDKQFSCD